MIVHPSIFALPLILVISVLDLYIFLACIRLSLSRLGGARTQAACAWLRQATDGLPQHVEHWLACRSRHYPPRWLPWAVVIGACLVLRYLLLWLVVTVL